MIKSEKGNTQLKGLGIEILADFGAITYSLLNAYKKTSEKK